MSLIQILFHFNKASYLLISTYLAFLCLPSTLAVIDITTLNSTQGFRASTSIPYSRFGSGLYLAGDVNRDGFPDMIVGASGQNSSTGAAYIIYGGPSFANISDVEYMTAKQGIKITGIANSALGSGVCYAGDMNNDGYDDVLILAYGVTPVYIVFGGPSLSSFTIDSPPNDIKVVKITAVSATSFGVSGNPAGDVNNDGYDDVIIGSTAENSYAGAAYIIFGGPSLATFIIDSSTPSSKVVKISGQKSSQRVGTVVRPGGDIDKDGYDDIVLGSSSESAYFGGVYIIFGGPSLSNFNLTTTISRPQGVRIGGNAVINFGGTVRAGGDYNNDGYIDLLVGAKSENNSCGAVYVIFGGPSMSSFNISSNMSIAQGIKISGSLNYSAFGSSAAYIGDLNKDGYSEIIVSASSENSSAGAAYVFFGGPSITSFTLNTSMVPPQGFKINTSISGAQLGSVVTPGIDLNRNGFIDLLISAPNEYLGTGAIYVYEPISCLSNQYIESRTFTCANCPANCSSCTSPSNCLTCSSQGYVLRSGTCVYPTTSKPIATAIYALDITATILVFVSSILQYSNASLINFYGLSKNLLYSIYLNINYPSNLEAVFQNLALTYARSNDTSGIHAFIRSRDLPPNFRNLNTSFALNLKWNILIFFCTLIAIGLLVPIKAKTRSYPRINNLAIDLLHHLKFNFLIVVVSGIFIQISFYTSLELWDPKLDSPGSIISLVLAIFFNLLFFACFAKYIYILDDIKSVKSYMQLPDNDVQPHWQDKWQDYRPLFQGLNYDSKYWTEFVPLICIRSYISGVVFGALSSSPIFQSIILLSSLLFIFIYTAVTRPIGSKYKFALFLLDEFLILLVYVFIVALAIMDYNDPNQAMYSVELGLAITVLYLFFYAKFIAVVIGRFIARIVRLYIDHRRRRAGAGGLGPVMIRAQSLKMKEVVKREEPVEEVSVIGKENEIEASSANINMNDVTSEPILMLGNQDKSLLVSGGFLNNEDSAISLQAEVSREVLVQDVSKESPERKSPTRRRTMNKNNQARLNDVKYE